jgi:hypothetical protein
VDSQKITAGQKVTLSAANSTDADGDVLNYRWEQLAGTSVSIGNSTSATASFTVPQGIKAGEVLTLRRQNTRFHWSRFRNLVPKSINKD